METVYQKLWDAAKAVWGGKFIVINADIKKIERSQWSKLSLYFRELENREQTKSTFSRRSNNDQGRNKWNRDHKNSRKKNNKTESWFFDKVNKIDKSLTRLT